MIKPTDEMIDAFDAAIGRFRPFDVAGGLRAVLAIVERDYDVRRRPDFGPCCLGYTPCERRPGCNAADAEAEHCGKPVGEHMLCARPRGCPCGWSESSEYDLTGGPKATPEGYRIDQWGGATPAARPRRDTVTTPDDDQTGLHATEWEAME